MSDARVASTRTNEQRSKPKAGSREADVQFGFDPAIAPLGALAGRRLIVLQRLAGNAAVSEIVARRRAGAVPIATSGRSATRDRWPDSQGAVRLQRQTRPAQPATLTMGSLTVTTYADLNSASRFFIAQLKTDATEVPTGERSRTAADDLVKQAEGWAPFLQGKGSEPLGQAAVNQATIWYEEFVQARKDLESWKKAKVAEDMRKAAAEADQARAAVDAIPESVADLQRGAFLAKHDSLLHDLTEYTGKALQVSSALLEIHEKCMEMVGWLSNEITHADELIEKFGPMAEVAHKVVAAYEGLSAAMTMLKGGEGVTEMDKAASKASAGLGVASAAGSLTGVGAAYMVYFGALITVGQAVMRVAAAINREHAHELNKLAFFEGRFDQVDWSAEPGGRAAFDFMVVVMHAGSSADIPTPVPEAVDSLMIDRGEQLEHGTGEEVPTEGFWFWKKTNPEKVKYWLMRNRNNIWAMLYGSVQPP